MAENEVEDADMEQGTDPGAEGLEPAEGTEQESKNPLEGYVPEARLGQVIAERNAAREQARATEAQTSEIAELRGMLLERKANEATAPAVDLTSLRTDMYAAINDGDAAKAADIQGQIDDANQARMLALVEERVSGISGEAATAAKTQTETQQFNVAVQDAMATHPEFDQDSTSYDHELTDDVLTYMNGLAAGGTQRSIALGKAIKKFIPEKKDSPFEERAVTQRGKNIKEAQTRKPALQAESNKAHYKGDVDPLSLSPDKFKEWINSTEGKKEMFAP